MMRRIATGLLAVGVVVGGLLFSADVGRSQSIGSALPAAAMTPADNPSTPARVALGRVLFWDPILSGNRDVACGTCHHPRFGYAENRDLSIGVSGTGLGERRHFEAGSAIPFVKRNSQTILNVAFNGIDEAGAYAPAAAPMFWDVRALSLEQQALAPLKSLEEMRGHAYPEDKAVDAVVTRLAAIADYRKLFTEAFGAGQTVSSTNLARALAAFQRSLTATRSPFDRYMRGDTGAMTAGQLRGMRRFERIGCANCHKGPMFSDFKLHVLGVPDNPKLPIFESSISGPVAGFPHPSSAPRAPQRERRLRGGWGCPSRRHPPKRTSSTQMILGVGNAGCESRYLAEPADAVARAVRAGISTRAGDGGDPHPVVAPAESGAWRGRSRHAEGPR